MDNAEDHEPRYQIKWTGPCGVEIVDETDDLSNARYLKGEYALAYGGTVRIYDTKRRRYVW